MYFVNDVRRVKEIIDLESNQIIEIQSKCLVLKSL